MARRFNLIISGRRWYKTTFLGVKACETALEGGWVIWGAPTADQCRTGMDEVREMLGPLARFNESRMEANIRSTGGVILWRSLDDPDNARSKTAHRIILDEICDVHAEAWSRVLRPMLMTTGGDFWGAGTPRGHDWVYDLWTRAGTRPETWSRVNAPTRGFKIVGDRIIQTPHPFENPDIPWSEMEDLWETTPERMFREENGAEFIEDGAGAFRNVSAMATHLPLMGPEPGHSYFIGCDWGQSEDYTVFLVYDATDRKEVALDRFRRAEYEVAEMRLIELVKRWRPAGTIAEENNVGKPIIEHLRRKGVKVTPFLATNASNQEWVDMLALAFERRTIGILNDETHVAELKAFRGERLPSGRWRYEAPTGQHDDTVDALGMAVWGATKVTRPIPVDRRRRILAHAG